jgi:hypothetical protein
MVLKYFSTYVNIFSYIKKNINFYLEDNIKNLKSLDNSIIFRTMIYNSMKLILSILRLIENKNDLINKNIPNELLIKIISFLTCKYVSICQYVCVNWLKILRSNLSKKILLSVPKNICKSREIYLEFTPLTMTRFKNDIYFIGCVHNNLYKMDTKNLKFKRKKKKKENMNNANIISSNENYVCVGYHDYVIIFSLYMKPIGKISIKNIQELAIDNNSNVLMSTCKKFSFVI